MTRPVAPRVVVAEDEPDLAELVRDNLLAEGCSVDVVADGEAALAAVRRHRYDLLILDVMLPGIDGIAVCETLRREGHAVPILFLTARGTTVDRIRGLEAGGDDYLAKPFHLRELLLRVRALLRRRPAAEAPTVRFGGNRVDLSTGQAVAWDGSAQQLSDREAAVLLFLLQHEGEWVHGARILEEVWRHDVQPSTRVVEAIVDRLRRRFESEPERPDHFQRRPLRGYRFCRAPGGAA